MTFKFNYCISKICKHYCKNTTLPGWLYITEENRTTAERIFWWIIQITALSSAIYLFYIISENFWKTPTFTTLDNADYHIRNVPFPAIAVCDINRISRRKATKFAKDRAPVYNITWQKMFQYVKYLGKLYDYDDENIGILKEFNNLLEANNNNLQFDYIRFINTMLNFTPPSQENLLACIWKTQIINCSQIFKFRRTMDGFCSTFNYEKSPSEVFIKNNPGTSSVPIEDTQFLDAPGPDMGLTLLVRSDLDDYLYPLEPMEGLKVFLYNVHDYPDMTSGSLVESLIPLGYEVFLQVDPVTVQAVDILRNYTVKQRQCLFSNEGTTAFDSTQYSHSDCLSECKMKSMLALCECIPFYMAVSTTLSYSTQLCTTADIPCLNKYKEKWNTISEMKYEQMFQKELAAELHNSIDCSYCLPDCSYTKYSVLNEYAPLLYTNNRLLRNRNLSEISLIHIYFDKETTILYKTDLFYYWYDIISNFGGMCGVFIGFSMISVIEFLYYFVFKFLVLLIKTKNIDVI